MEGSSRLDRKASVTLVKGTLYVLHRGLRHGLDVHGFPMSAARLQESIITVSLLHDEAIALW